MSVQRSPPGGLAPPSTKMHYSSDPTLNEIANMDENIHSYSITKRQKRTFDNLKDQSRSSISEIKNMFSELKEQQDHKFELLNNTLTAIMTQNQDLHKSLEMFTNRHEELLQKIYILEQENNDYKKRVCVLEHKLDHLERNASSTTIEIRNLSKQNNENKEVLTHIIQKLGSTLGLETSIQESEIRNIYRFRSETLVVDFTTSLRKESIVSKYKIYNKAKREGKEPQLNSDHINLPGPSRPIYIYLSI
ncbi:unnamed protein product [Parnassius apollo]|uniref:(apollo) hypothetical protein n=1 Tax=Parnassius apollo TaxID=110799 RepID=A0A8S3X904_PARAO|nr:unnamed protein product [Parnassius apollo]